MGEFLKINTPIRRNRRAKWGLDYYSPWDVGPDGKKRLRKKAFFKTKIERDKEIERLTTRFAEFGKSAGESLSPADLEDYRAARALLPAGVLLREAARAYVKQIRPDTPLLHDVIVAYESSLTARGLTGPWIRNVKSTLTAFEGFAVRGATKAVQVGHITTERCRAWMKSLEPKEEKGKRVAGYSAESRNNFRRRVHGLFEYAVEERMITENPMARVEVPQVLRAPPEFYSVEKSRAILAAAVLHRPDFVRFLVLRMFAGIRRSEVLRMRNSDIDVKRRIIDLPGTRKIGHRVVQVTKSKKRRILEDLPPVIWKWLARYDKLNTRSHQEAFRDIFKAARVKPKKNAFRHGFPTFHVALEQSANRTILILGQEEDSKVFYAHYRNPSVEKKQAEAYFNLGPDDVLPSILSEQSPLGSLT